jgi:hypothetical protein
LDSQLHFLTTRVKKCFVDIITAPINDFIIYRTLSASNQKHYTYPHILSTGNDKKFRLNDFSSRLNCKSSAFSRDDTMQSNYIMALTPAGLPDPSIAIAASRAGGLGILDLEFVRDMKATISGIKHLCRYGRKPVGIKFDGNASEFIDQMIKVLPEIVKYVILTAVSGDLLSGYLRTLQKMDIAVLVEATSLEQAQSALEAGVGGLIAKGHEAGGWVGEETTFILLQRMLSHVKVPVWAHGGIGLHTAAACYAAGAAGVVLGPSGDIKNPYSQVLS